MRGSFLSSMQTIDSFKSCSYRAAITLVLPVYISGNDHLKKIKQVNSVPADKVAVRPPKIAHEGESCTRRDHDFLITMEEGASGLTKFTTTLPKISHHRYTHSGIKAHAQVARELLWRLDISLS